jgi:Putative zinc-finger
MSIGAFLVGALDPTDRQELRVHLDGCAPCRRELALLAQLPGLLHRLTVGEARYGLGIMTGGAPQPPDAGGAPYDDGPELA